MAGTNAVLGSGGIHHVAITVADFDASVGFYTKMLGFREMMSWTMSKGKRAAMLDAGDGGCIEVFEGGGKEPQPQGAWAHIALRCADVAGAIRHLEAAGVEVTMQPTDVDVPAEPVKPIRIAFFKGPDGEIVELFEERG